MKKVSFFTKNKKQNKLGKYPKNSYPRGISVIEIILALSILAMTITAITGLISQSQKAEINSTHYNQAIFIAQEGLEAARNLRDNDFLNLTNGEYGISENGQNWELVANPTFEGKNDFYERTITISDFNADTKLINSEVTWQVTSQEEKSVILTSYLSNWQEIIELPFDGFLVNLDLVQRSGKWVRQITLENIGIENVTIEEIKISWFSENPLNNPPAMLLEEIQIGGGQAEWRYNGGFAQNGGQVSGTIIDITDFTFAPLDSEEFRFRFDKNASDQYLYNVTFYFSNGETYDVPNFP